MTRYYIPFVCLLGVCFAALAALSYRDHERARDRNESRCVDLGGQFRATAVYVRNDKAEDQCVLRTEQGIFSVVFQ